MNVKKNKVIPKKPEEFAGMKTEALEAVVYQLEKETYELGVIGNDDSVLADLVARTQSIMNQIGQRQEQRSEARRLWLQVRELRKSMG